MEKFMILYIGWKCILIILFSNFIFIQNITALLSMEISSSDSIIGMPSIIDGDTLKIHGIRIRFHGCDAPESRQQCLKDDGKYFLCGRDATHALSSFIGQRMVSCKPLKRDRYKRIIARCTVDNEDIESWMVRHGYAVAYRRYSKDYVVDEEVAKAARLGLWATKFEMPWDWRRRIYNH